MIQKFRGIRAFSWFRDSKTQQKNKPMRRIGLAASASGRDVRALRLRNMSYQDKKS